MTIIHVVQVGETIYTISALYGMSAEKIISDNELVNPFELVIGQAIVIAYPTQTYIVQEGDTIPGIAEKFGISILQLYRNNPGLSVRKQLYLGEEITIRYDNNLGFTSTNGYANEYIRTDILEKTLPYLTYLSVFGYRILKDGSIIEIDDTRLLQITKAYGVAPLLILTTLSNVGEDNFETAYELLLNDKASDTLINNLIPILKEKGYYGVNITYQLLNNYTLSVYEKFNSKLYHRLNSEGFKLFVSISPNVVFASDRLTFEKINYSRIFKDADIIDVLSYLWGTNVGPPSPVTSLEKTNEFLDFIIPQTTPDKLVIGIPILAYDWELPYVIGLSKALVLTPDDAIRLASQYDSILIFDDNSQTPYFRYYATLFGIVREHIVWTVDSRTSDSTLRVTKGRALNGTGLWNIMIYNPRLWLIINTQYEIINIDYH